MMASGNLQAKLDTEFIPLLRTVTSDSLRDAATLRFNNHHHQQLTAVCVYCTLIELAHGELALLETGHTTTLPVVLRSIFEAYADCRAVIEDPGYYKNMYATFLAEKIRLISNVAKSQANPFFADIDAKSNAGAEVAKLKQELEQYKKEGRGSLSTDSRFKAAKLEKVFQSIYWHLCLEGHNNISALDDRHIEKNGDEFEIVLFKAANPDDIVCVVDSLIEVLIDSAIKVHRFMATTDVILTYEAHKKRLDEIRVELANV